MAGNVFRRPKSHKPSGFVVISVLAGLLAAAGTLHSRSGIAFANGEETEDGDLELSKSESEESALQRVTGDELHKIVAKNNFVLAEFYAPWCGHCKSIFPELQKAAEMVKKAGLKTVMVQIDATTELSAASEFEIQGYPTFKFFRNKSTENPIDADFGRTANSIFDWVMTQEKGPMQEVTAEALKNFVHEHRALDKTVSILAYAVRKTKRVKLFEDFAREKKAAGVRFFVHYVTDKEKVKVEFYRWSQSFKIKDEEEVLTYKGTANGGWSKTDLIHYLKKAQERIVLEGIGYPPFQSPGDAMTLLWIITSKKEDDLQEYVDQLYPLAREKKESLQVNLLAQPVTGDDMNLLREAGVVDLLNAKELALLVEMDSWEERRMPVKYLKENVKDAGEVKAFVSDYEKKRLTQFRKSQFPVPEQTDDVVPLVADTFELIALDPKKHVFVMYYAPWCGHCKELKPIWSELAADVARSKQYKDKVILANMDATANDLHDQGAVAGYPSLVLYSAGTKTVSGHLLYSGQRTKEELWNFLEDAADVDEEL